ncbi:MAG TPA: hypothetical protein VGF01_10625, partial [Terracidiphilus sp.]
MPLLIRSESGQEGPDQESLDMVRREAGKAGLAYAGGGSGGRGGPARESPGRVPTSLMEAVRSARKANQEAGDGKVSAEELLARGRSRSGLFATCANPICASGWLHLWRSRQAPVFEGGWSCSPACTAARLEGAVRRELEGRGLPQESHRHRVPLGLVMLEQGWITAGQLRQALDAQRVAGVGRLGQWLVRQHGVREQLVTRALGLQWSCPVLPLEFHDAEALTVLLPRLFLDAFGALPLRLAAGRLLYLGFEDRLDPVVALAVERMSGLRVESGLVQESLFAPAHTRMLNAKFPPVELIEATSEPAAVHALARLVERMRPVESRLV